jgi:uncharacterized membrane protein
MKVINKEFLIKSILYRSSAFIFIFLMCLILTKEVHISVIAGIIEFAYKMIFYYIYEVFWKKITEKWGTKNVVDSST